MILQFEAAKQLGLEHFTSVSILPFLLGKKVLRSKQRFLLQGPLPQVVQPLPKSGQTPS